MDLNYYYYKDIMSYSSYIKKRNIGSLPFIYKGYVKYLHEKLGIGFTYKQFANNYLKYGYNFIKDIDNYRESKIKFKTYYAYLSYKTKPNDG